MNESERFKRFLEDAGVRHRIIVHEQVVTIEDVRRVLEIPYKQMAKSLVLEVDGDLMIAVLPGMSPLDKGKLARLLGVSKSRVRFASRERIEGELGLQMGGIPPFGLDRVVVLAEELLEQNEIYCGCGSLNKTVVLSPLDLKEITQARIGSICRSKEGGDRLRG